MMLANTKAERYDECLAYWRQLVCVEGIGEVKIKAATYNTALKSAVATGQLDEMEHILALMQVRLPILADLPFVRRSCLRSA